MKKKILSIILILAMVLTLSPALSAFAADGVSVLMNIGFKVEAPKAGDTCADGRADSYISLYSDSDYTVEWASWATMDETGAITLLADKGQGITFEPSTQYYIDIVLKGNDNIDFYFNPEVEAEGAKFEKIMDVYNSDTGTYSAAEILVSVVSSDAAFEGMISNITINVPPPLATTNAGYPPKISVPTNQGYSLAGATWVNEDKTPLDPSTVFEEGKTYYIQIELLAASGCWWNQIYPGDGDLYEKYGSLKTTVNKGELVGHVSTMNTTGSYNTASLLISIQPEHLDDGLVPEVNLGLTLPEAGTKVTVGSDSSGRIKQTPSADSFLTIPEGKGYKYSSYWSALWADENEETIETDFTIEEGKTYYMMALISPESGHSINTIYTNFIVQGAEILIIDKESGTYFLYFKFTIPKDYKWKTPNVDENFTGIAEAGDGTFYYVVNGEPDLTASRIIDDGLDEFYVINGIVDWERTKLIRENGLPFVDVPRDAWFYYYVAYVYGFKNDNRTSIMSGYQDGIHFGPTDPLSRGQFAVMLYRMENEPETTFDPNAFPDVKDGFFYSKAAVWANTNKYITGYQNGLFGPADLINREQLATILYRYAKAKGYDISVKGDLSKFPDAGSITPFATDALNWANGAGIIPGTADGRINPQGSASRAECATMIQRFIAFTQR